METTKRPTKERGPDETKQVLWTRKATEIDAKNLATEMSAALGGATVTQDRAVAAALVFARQNLTAVIALAKTDN